MAALSLVPMPAGFDFDSYWKAWILARLAAIRDSAQASKSLEYAMQSANPNSNTFALDSDSSASSDLMIRPRPLLEQKEERSDEDNEEEEFD
jgi:hypothetical protein